MKADDDYYYYSVKKGGKKVSRSYLNRFVFIRLLSGFRISQSH